MKVKFVPQNVEVEIKPNESVLHVAQSHGVHIQSICKGVPSCTECRIRVVEGEFNVFPPNQKEITLIGNSYFVDHRRLSCQLKCFGDITIDLTEQVEKAEQASASKRPRGARSEYDASTSQAKHGNIIFEGDAAPDAVVAESLVETSVPADERMVKYESNLKRAESDLFAEETKRQLQSLKGRDGNSPQAREPAPRGRDGSQDRSGSSNPRGGNRQGREHGQGRDQGQGREQGQGRDQNSNQDRNRNRNSNANPPAGRNDQANRNAQGNRNEQGNPRAQGNRNEQGNRKPQGNRNAQGPRNDQGSRSNPGRREGAGPSSPVSAEGIGSSGPKPNSEGGPIKPR